MIISISPKGIFKSNLQISDKNYNTVAMTSSVMFCDVRNYPQSELNLNQQFVQ